jgi:hypothetical protein
MKALAVVLGSLSGRRFWIHPAVISVLASLSPVITKRERCFLLLEGGVRDDAAYR